MHRPISDRAAIGFSTAFYRHLAKGDSIDVALTEGRQAIHSAKPESFEWATPVLFLRMPEGNVFVAKAAEPRAEAKPPVIPPASAPVADPVPVPVAPKRGWVTKVAVGAGGVVLVTVISMKMMGPSGGTVPPLGNGPVAAPTPSTTPSIHPEPTPKKGRDSNTNLKTERDHQTAIGQEHKEIVTQQTPAVTPTPAPTPVKPIGDVVEAPAPVADLSKLSAQASIQPQEGSIHVTVIFRNDGSQRLSVNLDNDQAILTDEQGMRYSATDCNLPVSGANPHLDLAANKSTSGTFDFPAPKLGSKKFKLSLMTVEGHRIKVNP